MTKRLTFKNDAFRKHRGGHSRWLLLKCEKCGNEIAIYQKDGPGILKRLYLDRMTTLQKLIDRGTSVLICQRCDTELGVKINFSKENRLAYRLFAGAIVKEIIKADVVKNQYNMESNP